MKKISLAFFGSPDFAADFLEKLITDTTINQLIEVKLVVTQPDQLVGRKQILTPTPVKEITEKCNIPVFENLELKIHNSELNSQFSIINSKLQDVDLALVYAFGDLIPKELLTLPKYGFWNIHPSLLPKYRGPSPIATPLINGDKTTGVTIIKMDEEIDHGPIIAQESLTINETDYRPDLEKKLTNLGFEMFKKIIKDEGEKFFRFCLSCNKNCDPESLLTSQNHKQATYTQKLTKHDGFVSFENLISPLAGENSSEDLYNLFRGLHPWPGIWTVLPNGKRLKITKLIFVRDGHDRPLQIKNVQLEGKNEVDFETFNKAYKIF